MYKFKHNPDYSCRHRPSSLRRHPLAICMSFCLVAIATPAMAQQVVVTGGGKVALSDGWQVTATPPGLQGAIDVSGVGSSLSANGVMVVAGNGVRQEVRGVRASDKGLLALTGGSITTNGKYGWGIVAQTGGKAAASEVSIMTQGQYAYGVHALNSGSQIDFSGGRIETSGDNSHGAWNYGAGSVVNITDSYVKTVGNGAHAINTATSTKTTFTGGLVATDGVASHAFYASGGGSLSVIGDGWSANTIGTLGAGSYGVYARTGATINLNAADITTLGAGSTAVVADGAASITANRINIKTGSATDGANAHGVVVGTSGRVALTDASVLTVGESAQGLFANGVGSSIVGNNVNISTYGQQSAGVVAQQGGGIDLQSSRIDTYGQNAYGIVSGSGSRVTATDVLVQTNALSSHALSAESNGHIELIRGEARAIGERSMAVQLAAAEGATASVSLTDSDVYSDQSMTFQIAGNGVNDIVLRGTHASSGKASLLGTVSGGTGTVNFTAAGSELSGNVEFDGGYTSSLALNEGTHLRGSAINVGQMQLSDSTWTMTGDSTVGNLSLQNSTLAFDHGEGAFKTLTVSGDYVADNGVLQMNSVLGTDSSDTDRLHVLGNTGGQTRIAVGNIGGQGAQTQDGIRLVQVDGESNGAFDLMGRAVGGAYEYFLHKGGETDPSDGSWYLRSALPVIEPVDPGTGPDGVIDPPVDPDACPASGCIHPALPEQRLVHRPETGAYLANQAAAVSMFDHSMHERIGEPNLAERLKSDVVLGSAWVRTRADHSRSKLASGQLDAVSRLSMLQAGADLAKWGENSRGLAGVMVSSGRATSQSTSNITRYGANGSVDGKALGAYATWFQSPATDAGAYVDAWVQASRFKNTVQGDALAKERYDSKTLTGSVEAGYSFQVREAAETAVYIEPQLQLSWTDFSMDEHAEGNGTAVRLGNAAGLQTRVGVRAYGHGTSAGRNRVQPFVGVNWIRASGAGNSLLFNETYIAGGTPRDIYQAKAGAQLQMGGGWSGWGELSATRGKDNYQGYAGQLGVKYSW